LKPVIAADALVAHLQDEVVILHAGTKDYFRLNATGQTVWRLIERGLELDEMVAAVVEEYEVSPEAARADVLRLLDELRAAGLVQ